MGYKTQNNFASLAESISHGMNAGFKNIVNSKLAMVIFHLLAWAIFTFFPFLFYRIRILDSAFFIKQIINTVFLAGFFYLNMYVLVPRFFSAKKLVRYLFLTLTLIAVIVLEQFLVEYLFDNGVRDQLQILSPFHRSFTPDSTLVPGKALIIDEFRDTVFMSNEGNLPRRHVKIVRFLFVPEIIRKALSASLFILFLSGFIKIGKEWFKTEKQRKELENQQLNAELALLKSQVNPHFLFNTLNSIYSLAHKKSELTEKSVLMLSEIMRYMMVDSSDKEVPLPKEIRYLEDYINLQKLRLSKDVDIEFKVEGDPGSAHIAPMLLITFVENAFKHGISYIEKSFIHIFLTVNETQIRFSIVNRMPEKQAESNKESGHGLENTRKRLELLYPGRHDLQFEKQNGTFTVKLIIDLAK